MFYRKKRYVAITNAIKKAGFDFEHDVEDAYQGHKALWKVRDFLALYVPKFLKHPPPQFSHIHSVLLLSTHITSHNRDDASFRTDTDVAKLEDTATVAREVVKILDDERRFRETILETFEGEEACTIEWVRRQCDFDRFYRKAREWWHSRARNIDVHRWVYFRFLGFWGFESCCVDFVYPREHGLCNVKITDFAMLKS